MTRKSILAIASVVLAVGATAAAPSVAKATAADQGTWHIYDGAIVGSSGTKAVNAQVQAFAIPVDHGQSELDSQLVGSGTTDSTGSIDLWGALPSTPPDFTNPDGTVTVELDVTTSVSFADMDIQVPAAATSDSDLAGSITQNAPAYSGSSVGISGDATSGLVLHAATDPTDTTNRDPDNPTEASAASTIGVGPGYTCLSGYSPVYIKQSTYVDHYEKVAQMHTAANASIGYTWNNSSSDEYGIVFNATGTVKGLPYQISSSGLASNTSSAGVSHKAGNNKNEYLEVAIRWYEWKKYCGGDFSFNQGNFYTGSWEWRPGKWTGGNQYASTTSTFTCAANHRAKMSSTTWVTRSSVHKFSAAATVAGISISGSTTNSSSNTLTIYPNSGKSATICGNNDVPIDAQTVEESN